MKRIFSIMIFMIFLCVTVSAQSMKIEFPLGDSFDAGEKITLKVSLFDDANNPIKDTPINLIIEDAEKAIKLEDTTNSGEIKEITLTDAPSGFWKITANYEDIEQTGFFEIKEEQGVKFEIQDDILTITNTGNTIYEKTIQIIIGDTIGTKKPRLTMGESVSYRLIAPEGTYNIKVTDGSESITKNNVLLTGKVIGVLDEKISEQSPITGGAERKNNLVYIFVFVIIGATVLLTIERHYRKGKNYKRKK